MVLWIDSRSLGHELGEARASASQRVDARTIDRRSRVGLDWLVFFVADVQTGFGAFVAVFLTIQKWTQVDIGLVLTLSGLVSLFGQIPAGMLVDNARSLRATAAVTLVMIGLSAFVFAVWPIYPVVMLSRIVQAGASCVLALTLISLTVAVAGANGVSARLGRNASFASAGTGIAAAVMGACGYYLSSRAVFLLAAGMTLPAIVALFRIKLPTNRAPARARRRPAGGRLRSIVAAGLSVLQNRNLVIFAGFVFLFHLANAAMFPLAASILTLRSEHSATMMVAAAMVVPQFTVTALSPTTGSLAQKIGRKPLLLAGFGALALRGALLGLVSDPYAIVACQLLDGVAGAAMGLLVPLIVIDLTRENGRLNLAQGAVGCAMGVGAAISTTITGLAYDRYGGHFAFFMLAAIGGAAAVLLAFVMPETRPEPET